MKEITYFFGAGASCQSMPLVSNFKERFEVFEEFLSERENSLSFYLMLEIKDFKKAIASHFSFDTFFKKLFHQGVEEKIILKYKGLLLLFFLFEHLVEIENLENNTEFRKHKQANRQKISNFDPRYEALIAGLLKPLRGKTEFHSKVNFFTWNYDINLIFALKNFISPNEKFTDFVDSRNKGPYFEISHQVKIFHLNGFVFHPILNDFTNQNSLTQYHNIIGNYQPNSLDEYASKIKFSWEQEKPPIVEYESAITNSETIILIGYSLPLYNRNVDSAILNSSKLRGKKLIIQNLNPESIAEVLESDFNINYTSQNRTMEDPKIILSENCASFIVPNSTIELNYEVY